MTSNEGYIRKFIILNNYTEHFNEENRRVKGYVTLEIREGKGKLSLNVEGFKHHYENKIYKLYLLGESGRGLIEVSAGPIRIRDDGKGQLEWKFNPRDLGNTGLPIEKFNTIMIRLCNIDKQLDEEIIVPLAGFIDKKSRNILDITNELRKSKDLNKLNTNQDNVSDLNKTLDLNKEILQEKVNKTCKGDRKDQGYQNCKDKEKCEKDKDDNEISKVKSDEKKETKIVEEQEQDKDLQSQECEEQEHKQNVITEENYKQDKDNIEKCKSKRESEKPKLEEKIKHKSTYEGYKDETYCNQLFNNTRYYGRNIDQYNNQVVNYTLNILKFFEEVDPLNEKLEGHTWWEIEYDRRNIYRGFLPYYNYVVNVYQQYPFITRSVTCQGLIKKYRHYIFGIAKKEDIVKYYIYGVPGKFTRSEHPYNGLTGFTTWYQSSDSANDKNGYWLLYIDAASGKIVTPKKPMMPY